MNRYADQALLEYNSAENSPHPGGVNGRPFWNINSPKFTFVPTLQFPKLPIDKCTFRFTARDENGGTHIFESKDSTASLAPIWADIPVGLVNLKVEAVDEDGNLVYLAGTRTFFRCTPFPGRDAYQPKAISYRECARRALRFVYEDKIVQHWLTHGVPEPDYPHNVYPAKTIESIIRAMVSYAKLEPERSASALKLACQAADYLISISFDENHPLAFLPPTYSFKGLNAESINKIAPAAWDAQSTTMMIYPAYVGIAYLALSEATDDQKYLNAAIRIGEYYKKTVLPCGSWYLHYDCKTGKPLSNNICVNFQLVNFFRDLYEKTKDEKWHELETGCYKYISEICLKTYAWEGQFEDTKVTSDYQNLTHFAANAMINYIADNPVDNEAIVSEAVELMRFVEDQFVIWGKYPFVQQEQKYGAHHPPAGLEQYLCYVPIDSSTATIMNAFISMYRLKKDPLYLEKALTLADAITRKQDSESGMIPTFWIGDNCSYGRMNFWINCHIHTAFTMFKLAEFIESEGIE